MLVDRATRALRRVLFHERVQMTVKTAVAATLAWVAAELLVSGSLENYKYYAPLGAVVAIYPTVASSVRSSFEAVAAIAVGGTVGLAVHALTEPNLVALGLVVAGGVAAGGFRFLGHSRSLVPVVALFVLVVGGSDPWTYTGAYVGLALLGALIAVLVSLALPALRLTKSAESVVSAQGVLADQLEDLADGLRQDPAPGPEGWRARQLRIAPVVREMRESVDESQDARRGNPRARFHEHEAERQRRQARTLERVAVLVEDLVAVFVETHREDLPSTPLDDDLKDVVACALEHLAVLMRDYDVDLAPDDPRVLRVEAAMNDLTDAFANRRDLDPVDVAVLGAVVANLRRAVAAVRPVAA